MPSNQEQAADGSWLPSPPEPLWTGFLFRKAVCECGAKFGGREARTFYRIHWACWHGWDTEGK